MYRRPCWVEIDTHAFEENYRLLTEAAQAEVLAVVKANAYGHGLALCAPAAVRAGARWLGVTSAEEGLEARAVCPSAEILVISGPFPGQGAAAIAKRLTCVVWEPGQIAELERAAREAGCGARSVPVHLELDTGMSRQGVGLDGLEAILELLPVDGPLTLDGLMTHLYAADESDGRVTREQLGLLSEAVERVQAAGLRPGWLNVGNSAALLSGETREELLGVAAKAGMRLMLRPGLALYGLAPEFAPEEPTEAAALRRRLRRVLTWKTRVVSVRDVAPGRAVGYNGTFVATEPMRVALLAVGYADGLRRELSNRGPVLVAGERAPIVGRISMDQTVVDVTEISGVKAGDEAVLLGGFGVEAISGEEHARLAGTISWDIFTSISARVERVGV